MDDRERLRQVSDGSDARASGASWALNPAYRRENQPTRSGRSVEEWKAWADAWSEGWSSEDVLLRFWSGAASKAERG